jgi:hypothetical protein
MDKILHDLGIYAKVPAVTLPQVPEWACAALVILGLGIVLGVALARRSRARFALPHLRHRFKNAGLRGVSVNGDTGAVSVIHGSGTTEIPQKPYKDGKLPAPGFEGFRPNEIRAAALMVAREPHVVTSTWTTTRGGPQHLKIEPTPASPVMTEEVQRPAKDRSKPASAAAPSGPRREPAPEPASDAVH